MRTARNALISLPRFRIYKRINSSWQPDIAIRSHLTFPTKLDGELTFVNRRGSVRYDVFAIFLPHFLRNFKFAALISKFRNKGALKSARVRGNDTISTARRARYGYPAFTGFYTSYRVYARIC